MSEPLSTPSVTTKSNTDTRTIASSTLSTKTVLSNLKSKIGTAKWQDIIADEERDLIVYEIREQMLQDVLDKCYQKYLDKQSVHFTVHCVYLALQKVLNVYFQRRDPGENIDKEPCWQPDTEPDVSEVDSWASGVIPVVPTNLQDQMRHQSIVYPPAIVQPECSSKDAIVETTQTPPGHEPSLEASVRSDKQSEPFSDYRRQQRLGSSAIRPSIMKKHHIRKSNTLSTVQYNPSHTTDRQTLCVDADPLPAIMQLGGRQFPSAREQ